MLLSMTGHGDAAGQSDRLSVAVEIRSVNNRHLKVSFRSPDAFLALESQVEKLIRQTLDRGSVTVSLYVKRRDEQQLYQLEPEVLAGYWQQLQALAQQLGTNPPENLTALLALPGVVHEGERKSLEEQDWPIIAETISAALEKLQAFRLQEGAHMAEQLQQWLSDIENQVQIIAQRAPQIVADYRDRLLARLQELTKGVELSWSEPDVLRELSLFADRCDISEELARLGSHLQQFSTLLTVRESTGRKLDFLCQELFREVNTIGSKANDLLLSRHVVEIKAIIEKIRELVQNIE
jgi:uncharacterized protein (TIGR00255 family)